MNSFRFRVRWVAQAMRVLHRGGPPILALVLMSPLASRAAAADDSAPLPAKVQFNRDIRPIFSDTCFKCHGPDAKARKAKLRLDVRADALQPHDGRVPITPGDSGKSEAFRRLITTDKDDLMPPPEGGGRTLTRREIELIRRWIDQGADYQPHWAYVRPETPAFPSPRTGGTRLSPVDRFILDRLEHEGLKPVARADRATLLRRVSLDLTGLPPSIEESQAFERDRSAGAYGKVVDRLLASPRFGERMAVWWLDLVRYADTIGYHSDNPMHVWPYRDYVIRAFNSSMPFDRFTVEQLAGDLLPEATQDQKVASAYNRLLQTTEEGGAQAKEYEYIYACDRVRSAATTWLGATFLCAQCHDHKYDPFTMRDFYSLASFFADIQEPIVGSRGRGLLLANAEQSARIRQYDESVAAHKKTLETPTPELESAQHVWEKSFDQEPPWRVLTGDPWRAASGTRLAASEDGVVRASGEKLPEKDAFTLAAGVPAGVSRITAFRLEAMSDESLPSKGPGTAGNGNFVLSEFTVETTAPGATNVPVKLARAVADFSQDGFPVSRVVDGKIDNAGWAVLPQTGQSHVAVLELEKPLSPVAGGGLTVTLNFQSQFAQHLLGRFRVSVTDATNAVGRLGLPEKIRNILAVAPGSRSADQARELAAYYRGIAPILDPVRKELAAQESARKKFVDAIPSCLTSETGSPREVRIHVRGNWQNETGPAMQPAVPESLGRLSVEGRPTRLHLARWLVSRDNPVTARVIANRIWKLLYGTGLSKTLYDSGSQGELPSHPELLDWLADEFIRSGWDTKHLVRVMVMSEAYCRSSVPTRELAERDPYNRLLGRQTPFRLDAEFVRDNALAISGLLVEHVGGPSVFPYQPAGYWAALNFPVREWENSKGEGLYRRGLYTHWQRTFLHPSLAAFDACTREEATAERPRSNIPQQALALLNDTAYVEASRALAERVCREGGHGTRGRIERAFRLALNRPPSGDEVKALETLRAKHLAQYRQNPAEADKLLHVGARPVPEGVDPADLAAWTSVARTVLNLSETITRE